MKAKWVCLKQQWHTKDSGVHRDNLDKLSSWKGIKGNDLMTYKLFRPKVDLLNPKKGWHRAPILVTTNVECHVLIEPMAKRFAKIECHHVYCWPAQQKGWKQAPDPILWEGDTID